MDKREKALQKSKGGGKKSWVDSLDKSKYSPEKLARWRKDSERAHSQFERMRKDPHSQLPSTSPAGHSFWEEQKKHK